jgi:hypothetical protein
MDAYLQKQKCEINDKTPDPRDPRIANSIKRTPDLTIENHNRS